jgi:hypothetical protein
MAPSPGATDSSAKIMSTASLSRDLRNHDRFRLMLNGFDDDVSFSNTLSAQIDSSLMCCLHPQTFPEEANSFFPQIFVTI